MQNGTVSNIQGQDLADYGESWPSLNSTFHQDQYNIGTASALVDIQDGVTTTPGGRAIRDIPLDELVSALVASDIPRNETTQWSGRCLPDLVDGDDVLNKNAPLSVPGILYGIQNILKPNDTLIAEAGDSWFNAQRIRLPQGADFQIQIMYGSIG